MRITDIYKVTFQRHDFGYAGTFRNAKRFNIDDVIFFSPHQNQGTLAKGVITGVEKTFGENPEYKYQITIPSELAIGTNKGPIGKEIFNDIDCSSIFYRVQDAKQSAIKNAKRMHELELQEIDRFFSQFEKDNEPA